MWPLVSRHIHEYESYSSDSRRSLAELIQKEQDSIFIVITQGSWLEIIATFETLCSMWNQHNIIATSVVDRELYIYI